MVWVRQHKDYNDNKVRVSVFDTEIAAAKHACAEILALLSSFVLTDQNLLQEAREINDLIAKGTVPDYLSAIKKWNKGQINDNEYPEFWKVYERQIKDESQADKITLLPDEFFGETEEETVIANHVVATSGATCRKCNDHNEYATADNVDGTYLCRTCNMFFKVFS